MYSSDFQTTLRAITRLTNAAHLQSRRVATSHGVTGLELECLRWVAAGHQMTFDELALQLMIPDNDLLEILEALEERGLIMAATKDDEARTRDDVHIALTSKGAQVVISAHPPISELLARRLAKLSIDEQMILAEAAYLLIAALDETPKEEQVSATWPSLQGTS